MKSMGWIAVLTVSWATGCASMSPKGPYATVDDSYAPKAARHIERAEIQGLDGEMFVRQRPLRLDPGVHVVLVRSLKSDLRHGPKPEFLNLYLSAQACRAYAVAAKHECSTCAAWTPVIIETQDIPGCEAEAAARGGSEAGPAPSAPSDDASGVPPLP